MLPNKKPSFSNKWDDAPHGVPSFRRLRVYAFDPSLSINLDMSGINTIVLRIPWENIEPGPKGEYLEIIDFDPSNGVYYGPIDLNDHLVLAQDGLTPSESNPKFHQQMVYAVAMYTISNFENALGRKIIWARRRYSEENNLKIEERYVSQLRIYPHALRQSNAFYSPNKVAVLFGYFPATPGEYSDQMPGSTIFTCLSHDIIAHEVTHAILDGVYERLVEHTHPDNLAFHEAFADIVALFQRFTFPEVLRHQIATTNGDLGKESFMGQLAREFGEATGNYGALRNAVGQFNTQTQKWERNKPDSQDYLTKMEPHRRGSILVSAIFDTFINIYNIRKQEFIRIATNGSGVLPEGDLSTALINRLTYEANKTAQHILSMCIRALDYCPPNEITYGDFLRALITVDVDLVPEDNLQYRLAFIDAFKKRGIYPIGVSSMSVESLIWERLDVTYGSLLGVNYSTIGILADFLKDSDFYKFQYNQDRKNLFINTESLKREVHELLEGKDRTRIEEFQNVTDLVITREKANELEAMFSIDYFSHLKIEKGDWEGRGLYPKFEIHTLNKAERMGPNNQILEEVIVMITQRIRFTNKTTGSEIKFRGGVTLILDLDTMNAKYIIKKRLMDIDRLKRQLSFSGELVTSDREIYIDTDSENVEPFNFLHH